MSTWGDKVVLVTGASSGLGRAIAETWAAAGAKVVLAARHAEPLDAVADALTAAGRQALAIPTDVTDQASVDALMAKTIEHFGRLDVLVNNAGRSMRGAMAETTADEFRDMLDLNVVAVVRMTRAALPHLLAARGHLVNIGSLAGKSAARWLGAYPASKFAVTAYTQQLRLELEPQGLHVLLVCPGPIARDTPRVTSNGQPDGTHSALPDRARTPGGGLRIRPIRPERLAQAILEACAQRKSELIYPRAARLLFALMQLSPSLGDYLIRKMT